MKAILLAGGQGTRLRPLTLHTPKPIVPIFNRPFLQYQIDLIKDVPDIDEIVLSLNYRPERIEDVFGDGARLGTRIRYIVEPSPLGTGGAIKFAANGADDAVVVFNGDVLTTIDLASVIRLHRERRAKATIVLTPVENPSAFGLVETDEHGNVRRFVEKPQPDQITTNHINAGIYVLEPDTFDRIPDGVPWSIERAYFPSLVERHETFVAYVYNGYWIDIGTPDKYRQVHCDIFDGRYAHTRGLGVSSTPIVSKGATIESDVTLTAPCFLDDGCVIQRGSRIGPYTVIGQGCHVGEGASIEATIVWPNSRIGPQSTVTGAILGHNVSLGHHVTVSPGSVLGDTSTVTDYTRI